MVERENIDYDLGALSKSPISLTTPPQERPKSASEVPRDWSTFTASAKFVLTTRATNHNLQAKSHQKKTVLPKAKLSL